MIDEYRIIDHKRVLCSFEQFVSIVSAFEQAGWHTLGLRHRGQVLIYPEPADQLHKSREESQVLWKIAPYVTSGHSILEVTRDTGVSWIHLFYDAGTLKEVETPAHQWDIL